MLERLKTESTPREDYESLDRYSKASAKAAQEAMAAGDFKSAEGHLTNVNRLENDKQDVYDAARIEATEAHEIVFGRAKKEIGKTALDSTVTGVETAESPRTLEIVGEEAQVSKNLSDLLGQLISETGSKPESEFVARDATVAALQELRSQFLDTFDDRRNEHAGLRAEKEE
jgi:hypothetical protein